MSAPVREMSIATILSDWDGDVVQLTLTTGEKVTGQISLFMTGPLVAVNVDLPEETIYQISAIIGVRWVSEA
jgi:hypothetical protein